MAQNLRCFQPIKIAEDLLKCSFGLQLQIYQSAQGLDHLKDVFEDHALSQNTKASGKVSIEVYSHDHLIHLNSIQEEKCNLQLLP
jgi:hypothetical protein